MAVSPFQDRKLATVALRLYHGWPDTRKLLPQSRFPSLAAARAEEDLLEFRRLKCSLKRLRAECPLLPVGEFRDSALLPESKMFGFRQPTELTK